MLSFVPASLAPFPMPFDYLPTHNTILPPANSKLNDAPRKHTSKTKPTRTSTPPSKAN